jgi:hypothetical protein
MADIGNGNLARLQAVERRQDIVEPLVYGLVGDVREMRADLRAVKDDIRLMRASAEKREETDRLTLRWRIGTTLAVIMAILAAAAIVAGAL